MAFEAVVRAGSFVGGGQALGLTRSAAAKAVGRLEAGLGVRLLNRTTRTLSLTDEGRTFHDHCGWCSPHLTMRKPASANRPARRAAC
ncbi:LysR family transcriptional regulator [Pseudoroseomonas wenyumeiae]